MTFLLLVVCFPSLAQEAKPKDYFNKEVKEGQLATTQKFLRSMEAGQVTQALILVDASHVKQNPQIQKELTSVSALIQKIKSYTEVSEGLIVYEDNHNVYRCVYYDDKTEYQQIDLHYQEGNPASKIVKLAFKDEKTLKKEKDERELDMNEPPPPPPFESTAKKELTLNNETRLVKHKVFNAVEISLPEVTNRLADKNGLSEGMGFVYFASTNDEINITIRKMEPLNLTEVKDMMDAMSVSMYNGKILRSEILVKNKIKIFVTDIKGQWNGEGETIGMFRYYFNVKGDSYNLLMKYPAHLIESWKELKDKMIASIEIK
ncbi:MAG: hypothetical protein HOP30_15185 [Cyclobacteriaceae bacterium]|nr:hypothetical protein [Cyclobacteriaceae bacterium]